MEERQVSVEGEPRPLPDPFIVAATQNPIEYEGTYQLPEAQLDRFLLKLNVPLPPRDQEIAILDRHARGFDDATCPRCNRSRVRPSWPPDGRRCVRFSSRTRCSAISSTSSAPQGIRRRCSSAFHRAAPRHCWPPRDPGRGCRAATTSLPDDGKAMARPTLRHRVALRPEAELEGANPDGVLDGILNSVPVPR